MSSKFVCVCVGLFYHVSYYVNLLPSRMPNDIIPVMLYSAHTDTQWYNDATAKKAAIFVVHSLQ